MALYESYLDEDLDETLTEAYALDEDYETEDYDESGEDYDEARRKRKGPARGNWRSRRRSSRNAPATKAPVNSTSLRRAFNNVGDDVGVLRRKARMAEDARITALGVDIVGSALLTPKLEKDESGNITGIKNVLIPLIGIKLVGNMIGGGSQLDFKKLLPWILAAFLVSPDSLKQLGVEVNNNGTGGTTGSGKLLGNIDTTTLLLLGGIVLFATQKK